MPQKVKSEKIVATCGMGSVAQIIRFKSVNMLFDSKCTITLDVPSNENLETFESLSDFKNL